MIRKTYLSPGERAWPYKRVWKYVDDAEVEGAEVSLPLV